jgi:RNA polymerase sigma-70 factor (ECF subfamily)
VDRKISCGAHLLRKEFPLPDIVPPTLDHATAADQALVDAFRAGDVGSFEELYRRHHPLLLRRLTRLCGNAAVAEELAQETFLRAAQRIGTSGELHFRAWVLRIGTNIGIDHLRALRRAPAQSLDDMVYVVPAAGTTPIVVDTEASVEMRENARFVASVLGRLNPRHRQVLVMREIEGLDYRSIAERLHVSCSAIETLLFRARGRFREEYAKAITD